MYKRYCLVKYVNKYNKLDPMFTDIQGGIGRGQGIKAIAIMHGVYLSLEPMRVYDLDETKDDQVTTHHIEQAIEQIQKVRNERRRAYETWTCPSDIKTETKKAKVTKGAKVENTTLSRKRRRQVLLQNDRDEHIFEKLLRELPRQERRTSDGINNAQLGLMVYLLDTVKRYETMTSVRDEVYKTISTLPSSICRIIASLSAPIPEPRMDILHIQRWPCCLDKDGARVLGIYISYVHDGHYKGRAPLAATAVEEMRQQIDQGQLYASLLSKCLDKPALTYAIPRDCGNCS